jgi:hypothetical protein
MKELSGKSTLLPLTRRRLERVIRALVLIVVLVSATSVASAQMVRPKLDIGVTFVGDRTNPVNGANHWLTGGGFEYGVDAFRDFGLAG